MRINVRFLIFIVLIFSFGNFACKEKVESKGEAVIKVGVILPLTGDGAAYGKEEMNGIKLAFDEVASEGGISGKKVEVIYEDSKGLPGEATNAIQKLIKIDRVKIVIGDAFSSPTLAIVPIADKMNVLIMSPTASSPKLSGSSKNFFRVWPSDLSEASTMAEVAVEELGLSKLAILYGNNEYGIGLQDIFSKKITSLGKSITNIETYKEGDADFRTQLTKIKGNNPDGIYLGGYYKEFAKILKQAKELGIKAQFLSCGTFHEPELLKLAGNAAEGVVFVQPYFNRESADPLTMKFVESYEKVYKTQAGVYAAHGYDAAKVLIEVLEIVEGAIDIDTIRMELLKPKGFKGVTGDIRFLEGGDVIKPSRVMTVKEGSFTDFKIS